MAEFPYLWIYNNEEDQNSTTSGVQLPSTDIQPGNLYVKGDVLLNGDSIFNTYDNEKQKLINIFGKKHVLSFGVRPHADWKVEDSSAELWGTNLCISFRAKPVKTITEKTLKSSNKKIFDATIVHHGYIKNMSHVSFPNEASGPVCAFYTRGNGVEGNLLNLSVTLSSADADIKQGLSINANFHIPVALNYNKFAD